MRKKILVIAAHPDDEILGCGGTMARHTKEGDEVYAALLSEGKTSRSKERNVEQWGDSIGELSYSAQEANKIIGVKELILKKLPDNRMDSIDLLDVVKISEDIINKVVPDIIYTHHGGDLNIDHRYVYNAVITACRPLPGQKTSTILFFEVPSSTGWQLDNNNHFSPNWYVDIGHTLELKLKALEKYKSEMYEWPHARSMKAVKNLAHWRGSFIGREAAEAFVVGRNIV